MSPVTATSHVHTMGAVPPTSERVRLYPRAMPLKRTSVGNISARVAGIEL